MTARRLKDFMKICVIYTARFFLRVLWVFPVQKKRIMFNSFAGRQFSCNPKYVFLALREEYGDCFEYVWVLNRPDGSLMPYGDVRTVRFMSPSFIFCLMTSGAYVTNISVEPFIPKRKSQLFVCTWHGGGSYKALSAFYKKRISFRIMSRTRARMTDVNTSSCRAFNEGFHEDTMARLETFIESGMPRNDMFFSGTENASAKVRKILSIPEGAKIVLYAPTVRGTDGSPQTQAERMDPGMVRDRLGKRFGGPFVFLFRAHISMKEKMDLGNGTVDVSSYDDMQELLCAADILITDYSSCVWDFSLTGRPAFLFTPDLEQYEKEQGFHVPIREWPFELSLTMEELLSAIERFDESSLKARIAAHHRRLGSFEHGSAGREVAAIIAGHCMKTKVMGGVDDGTSFRKAGRAPYGRPAC